MVDPCVARRAEEGDAAEPARAGPMQARIEASRQDAGEGGTAAPQDRQHPHDMASSTSGGAGQARGSSSSRT